MASSTGGNAVLWVQGIMASQWLGPSTDLHTLTATVPPGAAYALTISGSLTALVWSELR